MCIKSAEEYMLIGRIHYRRDGTIDTSDFQTILSDNWVKENWKWGGRLKRN
jgi:hypothetical protein